ncbi:nucleopolyhedrovirus P10 family protein [Streptomyces sp. NPDC002577]
MTADRWAQAVRRQLALGRLLPLGGPRDGAWLAESAADSVLRGAADALPGIRLGPLRISPADPDEAQAPAVPPPPSGLSPGPLRITAEFAASPADPLPTTAERLRATLFTTATQDIGLTVTEVDLRVSALLDPEPQAPEPTAPKPATPEPSAATTRNGEGLTPPADAHRPSGAASSGRTDVLPEREEGAEGAGRGAESPSEPGADGDEARVAAEVLAVPGVVRLTGTLGGRGRAVHIEEHPQAASDTALPRRHVRIELAASRDHRALDVALAVRTAVTESLPNHPTVAVVVTELP